MSERIAMGDDLLAFARRVRRRHVRAAVGQAGLRVLLTLAVPCILVAWLVTSWRTPIALGLLTWTLVAAGLAAWRASRMADAALLRLPDDEAIEDPVALAELGDELATWLEGRRLAGSSMHAWLAQDVRKKLPRLESIAVTAAGRRSVGGALWLLPMALLLLLAWWLTNLLSPPWPGVLGGRTTEPNPSRGQGPGDGSTDQPTAANQPPSSSTPKPRPEPRTPPPPPPPTPQNEPVRPEAPAPVLELPSQQHFVVPEFVGDGPTRRARMHAAEIEQGAPAGSSTASTSERSPLPIAPPSQEQFARAAEAALASRHVPLPEQAIVRSYFDALQKAAK